MTSLTVTAQIITAGEGDAVGVMVQSNAEELDTVAAGILAAQALRLWETEHAVNRYRIRDLVWKQDAESSSALYDLADREKLTEETEESLRRGLEQSANGETVSRGSFAQYADDGN